MHTHLIRYSTTGAQRYIHTCTHGHISDKNERTCECAINYYVQFYNRHHASVWTAGHRQTGTVNVPVSQINAKTVSVITRKQHEQHNMMPVNTAETLEASTHKSVMTQAGNGRGAMGSTPRGQLTPTFWSRRSTCGVWPLTFYQLFRLRPPLSLPSAASAKPAMFLPLADYKNSTHSKNRRSVCRAWLTFQGSRIGHREVTQEKTRCR